MTYTLLVMINQLDLTCTHSGDLSPLVQTIQAQASYHQRQAAVLISGFKSVALLIWETGAFAIFDSHMHAQFGAMQFGAMQHQAQQVVLAVPLGCPTWYKSTLMELWVCVPLPFVTYDCT